MHASVALPVGKPAPLLTENEVQFWLVDLRQSPERLEALTATLAADERRRAAQFRSAEHREGFIAGRGLLRELLGAYLNQSAVALRFTQGLHGKPMLISSAGATIDLYFNLSHSHDQVLFAVAHRELGVDLECMGRTVSYAAIAKRICTSREWAAFQALPAEQLRKAFFACWTRKEAIAKALGIGLAGGLGTWEVCFTDDVSSLDCRVSVRDANGQEWSVLNLPLEPDWSGALAASGSDWRWRGWRWR